MTLSGTWTKLAVPALPRSSHSLSVIGNKAYIWGGELEPRRPVDTDIHVVDLDGGKYERIPAPGAPSPRVAHAAAAVGGKIYAFGGRGGPEMSPIDESGLVYVYDPAAGSWSSIQPSSSTFPEPRSYHSAAAAPGTFIIHGGCAASGRLTDTWAFDVATKAWRKLDDAPGLGRGGTALAVLDGKIWRFGGFDGNTEVGGAIDSIPLEGDAKWTSTVFAEQTGLGRDAAREQKLEGSDQFPGPRSVSGLHKVNGKLVLLYGEGRPSHTGGHDAAGSFWDDVWAYDPKDEKWEKVSVGGEKPGARGWFASDSGSAGVALSGGLDGSNVRQDDVWLLRLARRDMSRGVDDATRAVV